ncbi:pyridoxine 5'-phosphate synthase [Govanella unica]|uniref:Pyridoxine 5'-phosphate synthase n=1 Tax=Govanella unica TaxID=2975056 RepID=A0A9X3Z7H7_9PROT|nr:pyridoxine 5'-phosphate synthase [Govania unica]
MTRALRLGVNIDHVATIRNARGGHHPDPVRAAVVAARAGADGITAHLREDRRHISDHDIARLSREIDLPLNLEMAATAEMLEIALRHRPHAACIVPEKREELTTEGGLDVAGGFSVLEPFVNALKSADILVTLFVDPDHLQIEASKALFVDQVELHTGSYCSAQGSERSHELRRLEQAALQAEGLGLEVHAGHGLSYENVMEIARIPQIVELNIGHFLIGEAIFDGLEGAIRHMRSLMDQGRGHSLEHHRKA